MYQNPHEWQFQEQAGSSADDYLNQLQANLTDLASRWNSINTSCAKGKLLFIHFGKWLYYCNEQGKTATIKPYNVNMGEDTSLPDVYSAGGAIADLANAAEWLVFGQPYWVENAIFGIEMESV